MQTGTRAAVGAPAPDDRDALPLCEALIFLGRLLDRRLQRRLGAEGVTAGQYLVLSHVARRPGVSRAGIARAVKVTPQAVGGLTARLMSDRLLSRSGAGPGEPASFTITESGVRALDLARPPADALGAEISRLMRPDYTRLVESGDAPSPRPTR